MENLKQAKDFIKIFFCYIYYFILFFSLGDFLNKKIHRKNRRTKNKAWIIYSGLKSFNKAKDFFFIIKINIRFFCNKETNTEVFINNQVEFPIL